MSHLPCLPNEVWMVIFEHWHQIHKMFLTEALQENQAYDNTLSELQMVFYSRDKIKSDEFHEIIHNNGLCYKTNNTTCRVCYFNCSNCCNLCRKDQHYYSETKKFGLCDVCFQSLLQTGREMAH